MSSAGPVGLVVRRIIRASPEFLFDAWTTPSQLLAWWGPTEVRCVAADVDLRVGGTYRLGNLLADGKILYIGGEFLKIDRPSELVYTWRTEPEPERAEKVTVLFRARGDTTEVLVRHERIPDALIRRQHAAGWAGCLDGLAALVRTAAKSASGRRPRGNVASG